MISRAVRVILEALYGRGIIVDWLTVLGLALILLTVGVLLFGDMPAH